jgi:1-acyl-sn-glycerol-3-phosphate acyltransferase
MKILKLLANGIAAILILSFSAFYALIGWWLLFIPKQKRYKYADNFMVFLWAFFVNRVALLIRLKVIGKGYVDKKRTSLYICNHQSWNDIPIVIRYSHATGVAKKEVAQIPIVGILIQYAGALLFDRDDKSSRLSVIKDMITYFKNGTSLCIFPEGTRSLDGTLLAPNLTTLKLCYKMGIPVVPTAIEGTRNVLARHKKLFNFFQKTVIQFTPPIYPKDFATEEIFSKTCWETVITTHTEICDLYFKKK